MDGDDGESRTAGLPRREPVGGSRTALWAAYGCLCRLLSLGKSRSGKGLCHLE